MRTVELDADSIVYDVGFALDNLGETPEFGVTLLNNTIKNIMSACDADKINVYLGTDSNFRIDIATIQGYKANRDNSKRPYFYDFIRQYFIKSHNAILVHNQEAEDAAAIACMQHKSYDDYVLGAIDKDLNMIPGWHYNWRRKKLLFIDEIEALRNFYMQLAAGDATDNIPGLYKLLVIDGEDELAKELKGSRYKKKLEAFLSETKTEKEMWAVVESLYKLYGEIERNGYDRILEIARLLWIRRKENEMFKLPNQRKKMYL